MKKVVCTINSPPQETGFPSEVPEGDGLTSRLKWVNGYGKGKEDKCSYIDYVCLYDCTIRISTLCRLMLMLCAVYLPVYKVHLLLLSSYKLEKTRELGRCTFPAGPLSVTIAPWLALRDIASPGNKSPFLKRAGMGKKIYILEWKWAASCFTPELGRAAPKMWVISEMNSALHVSKAFDRFPARPLSQSYNSQHDPQWQQLWNWTSALSGNTKKVGISSFGEQNEQNLLRRWSIDIYKNNEGDG